MAGQIRRRGERTWLVRVYLGRDAAGKRKWHSKTIHGTKKAAERYVTRKLHERDTGELFEPTRLTLNEYLDTWLTTTVATGVRKRTAESYKSVLKRNVRPNLGDRFLGKLTAADLRGLYGTLAEKGLSPRTVRQTHEVLRNALEGAVEDGLIRANPASVRSVRKAIPPRKRSEHVVVSKARLGIFLEAALDDEYAGYWLLMLLGGLRPEEALALRWADWDGDRVRIRRVLVDVGNLPLHFEDTKTEQSARTVVLPRAAVQALIRHRRRQAEQRLASGPAWQDQDLVFTTRTGGPLRQSHLRPIFYDLLQAAELPRMRVYDLRHSCATLLLEAGESAKVVSERLGHANIAITLDTYSHVQEGMQQEAAAKLDALTGGGDDATRLG